MVWGQRKSQALHSRAKHRGKFLAVTLCMNAKCKIWLDMRLLFYMYTNTGVMMYTDPTQTGCLKQLLKSPHHSPGFLKSMGAMRSLL